MKVLLTGGSGMVGRNVREHPEAAHWDILAPSRAELDLLDRNAVLGWMRRERPDAVVHAAGLVGGIQANIRRPVDFLVVNTDIGRNVILAAREAGVAKLLNLASSCMYPRAALGPLTEDMILQGELEPTNEGYALAKIFATRLCQYIRREAPDLQYKTLVPCNLYGRHDKFDPANSHLVPAIIHKVRAAKEQGLGTIEIWGDGTARREFMYAGDMADVVLRALRMIDALPDLMNVGIGDDHSINDYYRLVAQTLDWHGEFTHDLSKPVGMSRKLMDVSRQRAWGWQPRTDLSEGIRRTYRYFTEEYPG